MYVYEENACLDGTESVTEGGNAAGFSQNVTPPLTTNGFEGNTSLGVSMVEATGTMRDELHQQLDFDMGQQCFDSNDPDPVLSYELEDMGFNHHHHHHHHHHQHQEDSLRAEMQQNAHQNFSASYPPPPDLLNLFQLPRCAPSSLLQNSSISFTNPDSSSVAASAILYDPLFPLNLPPQPPVFRELFQSLPHGYNLPASRVGSLFGSEVDDREGIGGGYGDGDDHRQQFDNGVLKFTRGMGCIGKGRGGKGTKPFATEKQRREHLNDKYNALKSLVPNPTKSDRASVVGEAIEYIRELLRTVNELKLLVEKKRCGRERRKRQKAEQDESTGELIKSSSSSIKTEPEESYNDSLRSSWLQRKSKDTEVDVRIVDDEVTIKLVQRKKINCLLFVSKILDELQLDLHHVAGGHVGDYYSFLFNTKIYEGCSVYASAIASKLIDVVDRQYAAIPTPIPPATSF